MSREEAATRIAELIGHAMTHCQLLEDGHKRDNLLTIIMEVYREMGYRTWHLVMIHSAYCRVASCSMMKNF